MLILVTGGVASGKSEIAENLAVSLKGGKRAYIATMLAADEECRQRVVKHRKMREGKEFDTFEIPYGLAARSGELRGYDTALLECLSNLIANEMYLQGKSSRETTEEILTAVSLLQQELAALVIVSGTIFGGISPYDPFTEEYIRLLGTLNSRIGERADVVIEAVCGIPLIHKGEGLIRQEKFWPGGELR